MNEPRISASESAGREILNEFDEAMMELYRRAKVECNYSATGFLDMLHEHGGIDTAHILLCGDAPQYGFTRLWGCKRLDLTVECLVLSPKFRSLFQDDELETARQRLRNHHFNPDKCEQDSRQTSEDQ